MATSTQNVAGYVRLTYPTTIDFGEGSNDATLIISGIAGILSTSQVDAWLMYEAEPGGQYTANDAAWAASFISLTCGNIVPGVGFTIYATSPERLAGRFIVRYAWA